MTDLPVSIDQVVIGYGALCVTTKAKQIFCKGSNQNGRLGQGAVTMGSTTFVEVLNVDPTFRRLFTNGSTFCYNATAGVSCWGGDYLIRLANGADLNGANGFKKLNDLPTLIPELGTDVESIGMGESEICIVKQIGTVGCLGQSFGSNLIHKHLVDVVGINNPVTHVVSGSGHVCAISKNEKIYCWGSNFRGNLGVGVPNSTLSFSKIAMETTF